MNNLKYRRAILKMIADLGYEGRVDMENAGHWRVFVQLPDREIQLTASSTPQRLEISVNNVRQDILRYVRGQYQ